MAAGDASRYSFARAVTFRSGHAVRHPDLSWSESTWNCGGRRLMERWNIPRLILKLLRHRPLSTRGLLPSLCLLGHG